MKRRVICTLLLLIAVSYSWGQTPQADFEKSLPDSIKYVLPEFKTGRVVYNNGEFSNGAFNISTLDQSLRYIGENGEVLSLSNSEGIDRVIIGNMMFFRYNGAYLGVVESSGEILLCSSSRLVFDDSKSGAYGMKSSTTSISQIGRIDNANNSGFLNINKVSDYELKKKPYIYRNGRFYVPTRKAILKSFPNKTSQIEEFIKKNNPNFGKLEDMQALFNALK